MELLADEIFGHHCREPGHTATRMRQALDESECNRVGYRDEDERNRRSSGVDRERVWRRLGDDDLWAKRDELSHARRALPYCRTMRSRNPRNVVLSAVLPGSTS